MLNIRALQSNNTCFEADLSALLAFELAQDPQLEVRVQDILSDIKTRGDTALLETTMKFDRWTPSSAAALEIDKVILHHALNTLDKSVRAALEAAADRIRRYHERQLQPSWRYTEPDGTVLGQQITPLDRAGLYVPGGKAAYPSSVLMNAVAAKVAGVRELIMVTPTPDGVVNETVLAAAALAGVDRVFRVGGAQAVGALAYGTSTIPAVDKIVGPGNAYVAAAKRLVFGKVGIDMIAGPSEVLIVADGNANPDWIAADLLAQAEHDEAAQSILITNDASLGDAVEKAMTSQLATLPRAKVAGASWKDFGAIILVPSLDSAVPLIDAIAPEHLELMCAHDEKLVSRIRNAGAIFIGGYTPEAIGDYVGGSNHVLPTARSARFSSGLGVLDFMKRTSILKCGPDQLNALGPAAIALGEAEGLSAHARSVAIRLNKR